MCWDMWNFKKKLLFTFVTCDGREWTVTMDKRYRMISEYENSNERNSVARYLYVFLYIECNELSRKYFLSDFQYITKIMKLIAARNTLPPGEFIVLLQVVRRCTERVFHIRFCCPSFEL